MNFKLLLLSIIFLTCLSSAQAVFTISNASDTELINEDFSDDSVPAGYWACSGCSYSGGTLTINGGFLSSDNKLEIQPNKINETAGGIRFIANLSIPSGDLTGVDHIVGMIVAGKELSFYTQVDDTIDVLNGQIGTVCTEVEPADITINHLYEINLSAGIAIFSVDSVEVCNTPYNNTGENYYTIRAFGVSGDILVDFVNYSAPILAPTLNITSPINDTYNSDTVDLIYNITSSDPLASEPYNCTVTIDDVINDTYQDDDNVKRTISMPELTQDTHNVTVNCFDGHHNVSDTVLFTVDTILEMTILSPNNVTYTGSDMNVTYLPNTTAVVDDVSCTVYFDADANDTYTDSNNTERTFDFTQLVDGAHNVTVNCGDGVENITRTVVYTTSFVLELGITSPENSTYIDSDLTLTYLANTTYPAVNTINCTVSFDDNVNTTYNTANQTSKSLGFRELNPTFHNVSVNCYDGNENLTRTAYYTIDDVNFTLTQNTTAYEGVTNLYTVDVGFNTDIISHVNASLYWNETQIGFNEIANTSPSNTRANMTFMLPIITTNNTSINTKWNVTKLYLNGSSYLENSTTSAQKCWHAWDWDATTYSVNLIERSLNDISVNVSKLGGVGDPVNTTITAALVWNGSPSTMNATMNTSTKLGYSNTTRVPRIAIGYNWTFGFNVTLNYSINHGILGYHSRTDTNTTYNYTQTVHTAWIGNCTLNDKEFSQALNFYMYDEDTEGSVTENFQAERINIRLVDGTYRNYSLPQMTGYTNYSICIYPFWSNYTSVSIDVKYAINSSTYDDRRYYVINSTIDNTTDIIGLYNLNGIPITFTVLDETASEVANAYLDIRKFYSSINNYRTIAMAKTGDSGIAATYLDVKLCTGSTETLYSIDIYDNRSILIKSLPDQSLSDTDCDGVAEETLKITLGGAIYDYWSRHEGLSYSYSLANDSNNINFTSTVSDALGIVNTIILNCYKVLNTGNELISTESIASSSATITCELGDITGNSYIMQTIIDYPVIGDVTFTETIESRSISFDFGGDGLIAGFFLLVALAVGYATTPAMALVALIIGLIIINGMGLTLFSLDAIITLIFAIIFVIYIIGRKR